MAFIKKNWQKGAADTAVNAVMRIGGAGLAAFALNKLTSSESTNLNKTIKNISSPALTLIGVLGDMMLDDDKLKSLCQGVATFGALKSVAVIAPAIGKPLGLSGIDENEMPAIMNGVEPTITNGIGATSSDENTTAANPPELAEFAASANPDGKVFAQVADYIEQDADNAVKVNGVGEIAEAMLINN